jgi:hypothetical protein
LPSAEECLSKAQEYISLAEDSSDGRLRAQYLLIAKELTELAALLDAEPKGNA